MLHHLGVEALDRLDGVAALEQSAVYCKDCQFYANGYCYEPDGDGDYSRMQREPDGFCKWGQEKELK